jgi:hypothetical protein
MRNKEYKFYRRLGGAIWKNGEYLIEGVFSEEGVASFKFWASLDAETIGTAHTLEEAVDACADHRRGQKVLKFVPAPEEERNPFMSGLGEQSSTNKL